VNHVSISLEHVDLLDALDRLHVDLLKRSLELLVVGAGCLVDLLDLASGRTLSTVMRQFCQSSSRQISVSMQQCVDCSGSQVTQGG